MKKTVQRSEDCFIQFTEEELAQLGIKAGDKFTWEMQEDGSCLLKKHVPVELDLSQWSREILEMIISDSIKKSLPADEVICEFIEKYLSEAKQNG